jgi:shikimate dehydrogenase
VNRLTVIGNPVSHSLSPLIHNAALGALGLGERFHYEKTQVKEEEIAEVIERMRRGEIMGGNVIIPFKEIVPSYLDGLTRKAAQVGAVNTLYRENGKVIGHNTDGRGFLKTMEENSIGITGKRAVILGAGGTVRAIVFALTQYDIHSLVILNRTVEKGERLANDMEKFTKKKIRWGSLNGIEEELEDADIVIHCTAVGMSGGLENETLITAEMLKPDTTVIEVVYTPLKTKLLEEAEREGCKTINGSGMFIQQAVPGFKLWTGRTPPLDVMRDALLSYLEGSR